MYIKNVGDLLLHLNGLAKFVIMVRLTTKPGRYVDYFRKLQGLYGNILSCYEAGSCGFGLYHQLTKDEYKMPGYCPFPDTKITDRQNQNDHRDAISLAVVTAGW